MMENNLHLQVFHCIVLLLEITNSQKDLDPCISHTLVRDQYQRSCNYTISTGDTPLCDRDVEYKWYEFKAGSGYDMPTFPVEMDRCGTDHPIWLNGTLPSQSDDIVPREACVTGYTSYCEIIYDIEVKNCGNFYVYHLPPTDACNQAYCVGTEVKCDEGESSHNGYTPGCTSDGFPILTTDPLITYDIVYVQNSLVTMKAVVMLCDIEHTETDIYFDIYWHFGDETITQYVGENSIHYSALPVKLYEWEWMGRVQLGQELTCRMSPKYTIDGVPGHSRLGFHFMGMMVENTDISVVEGGAPSNYTFYPTIPVLCPVDTPCSLYVEVNVPTKDMSATSASRTSKKLRQYSWEPTQCYVTVNEAVNPIPSVTYSIPIYALTDGIRDNSVDNYLVVRTPESHPYHEMWQNYTLPIAQIRVVGKKKSASRNDWAIQQHQRFNGSTVDKSSVIIGNTPFRQSYACSCTCEEHPNNRDDYIAICSKSVNVDICH